MDDRAPHERETFDILAATREVEAARRRRRAMNAVGGVALVVSAVVTRGIVGVVLGAAGVALVLRGATGRSLAESVRLIGRRLSSRGRSDLVDTASAHSFPASDPPSYLPSNL